MENKLTQYEEALYDQLEDTKKALKRWQDRCIESEEKLSIITTKYNAVANELQIFKKRSGESAR